MLNWKLLNILLLLRGWILNDISCLDLSLLKLWIINNCWLKLIYLIILKLFRQIICLYLRLWISNWLLVYNYIYLLYDILLFNGIIFSPFCNSLNWYILNLFFLNHLRNVFNIILDCIIIGDLFSNWNLDLSSYFFIFCNCSFIWNVFYSWLTFYNISFYWLLDNLLYLGLTKNRLL